ncbi:MAG: citrate synthase [Magnetococcales bacterium]|nr:citrate synthase [Magnetococcales bacterium]MBF0116201.1 citrate synthase [Magnetococcales bacterium]
MKKSSHQERRRDDAFAERIANAICEEVAVEGNPYLAQASYCHGYDVLSLMDKLSFEEMVLLLLQGELPTPARRELLRQLMIVLATPGPRHPATRAAMSAGAGKSDPRHILPIALTIMGGDHLGAGEVANSMVFLRYHLGKDPRESLREQMRLQPKPQEGSDWVVAPGFGSCFAGVDPMAQQCAERLLVLPGAGKALRWGALFAQALAEQGLGWRMPGVAAACFLDLNISGMTPWVGGCLFQLLSAPGLLAHGLAYRLKPLNAYPFIRDDQYIIESDAQL